MSSEVGVGISCRNKLKSVGERTEPCGTPSLKSRVLDDLSLKLTCAILPDR